MRNLRTYFLDAHSGAIVHEESEVDEQQRAVGVGRGIQGQQKKVSTSQSGGRFEAYDRLRPAEIVTLDLRYNEARAESLLDPRGSGWVPSDVASDTDNVWADAAVVDGHAYAGFTYDYLVARQGWHGMNGQNSRIMSLVNIGDLANAFFFPPPFVDIGMDVAKAGSVYHISGQAALSIPGGACLWCMGVLREQLLAEEAADYGNAGIRQQVVWPNGVLASSAVGLFMSLILPWAPKLMPVLLEYDGNRGTVVPSMKLEYLPKTCLHFAGETDLGDPFWKGSCLAERVLAVGTVAGICICCRGDGCIAIRSP